MATSFDAANRFKRKFIWFLVVMFLFGLATMFGDWVINFLDGHATTGTADDFLMMWDPWLGWDSWYLWYHVVYVVIIMSIFPLAFAFAMAETNIWKHIAVIGVGFILILSAALDYGWSIPAGDALFWYNVGDIHVPYWLNIFTGEPLYVSGYFIFFSAIIRFILGTVTIFVGLRMKITNPVLDVDGKVISDCFPHGNVIICKRRDGE